MTRQLAERIFLAPHTCYGATNETWGPTIEVIRNPHEGGARGNQITCPAFPVFVGIPTSSSGRAARRMLSVSRSDRHAVAVLTRSSNRWVLPARESYASAAN